jgi:hypothetical protein
MHGILFQVVEIMLASNGQAITDQAISASVVTPIKSEQQLHRSYLKDNAVS